MQLIIQTPATEIGKLLLTEDATPLQVFVDAGGSKDHLGLIIFEIDGEEFVPNFLINTEEPGKLAEPYATINVRLGTSTSSEKLAWWNEPHPHCGDSPRKALPKRLLVALAGTLI